MVRKACGSFSIHAAGFSSVENQGRRAVRARRSSHDGAASLIRLWWSFISATCERKHDAVPLIGRCAVREHAGLLASYAELWVSKEWRVQAPQ